MQNGCLITARRGQGQLQRVCDISSFHRRAELPGDDVAGIVIEDRRQIEPAPSITRQAMLASPGGR